MKNLWVLPLLFVLGCAPLPKEKTVAPSVSPSASEVTSPTKDGVRFVWQGSAGSVFVAGSFNNWSTSANPLRQTKPGLWETTVALPAGSHQYKFVVDGNWVPDPSNPSTAEDGFGGVNSVVTVLSRESQKEAEGITSASAPQKVEGGWLFTYSSPQAGSVFVAGSFNNWSTSANPMRKNARGIWTAVIPLSAGSHQYKFVVDGNWVPDPLNPITADDGFGGVNSVVKAD